MRNPFVKVTEIDEGSVWINMNRVTEMVMRKRSDGSTVTIIDIDGRSESMWVEEPVSKILNTIVVNNL